ncbi:glycosyl transferase [Nocardiopsis gilva YIM 90087]|uniref:Glycosyl transferase n=1 Tax=Nocardiopsis gilva YIM 90087 TaxID=1235441 RepID=A0A223S1N2_9ACTN|nr:glycosyltransferase family 4 protein [Nocardiopsis gilva]ASU82035.1 glycosyl transferase [Nocardiopsis gilva YIM 90087]
MTAPTFVLPGGVDDPTTPSGGNVFDRRLCRELARMGRPVREVAIPGTWPEPDASGRDRLARALDALPDGAAVVVDGLVACGVPEIVVPSARRLRLGVLVHLPLADETGLSTDHAAELDAAERDTLRAARAVIATSRWAARNIKDRHSLDHRRVWTVEPGTDAAPLVSGTDHGVRFLSVASVTPRKGHDLLVRALAGITDLRWGCVCVGPAPPESAFASEVRRLVGQLGLGGRIDFSGPLSGDALAHAYAEADLLLLPSRAETFGMAAAEALARGIPVLATTAGALPDTLGQARGGTVPGLLVPPNDVQALAGSLRSWLMDGALRDRLRAAARLRRAELRPWEAAARDMTVILDRMHEPRHPRPQRENAW